MRACTGCLFGMAAMASARAAVDPFYRVGVVQNVGRRQFDSESSTAVNPGNSFTLSTPTTDLSTGTSTSSSATPTRSPFLVLDGAGDILTTCDIATIDWIYSGPADVDMSLAITNVGVEQEPAPTSYSTSRTITNTFSNFGKRAHMTTIISTTTDGMDYYTAFLSVTLNPARRTFTWSPINVPQGWYRFESNITGTTFRSGEFFVLEGEDTSCILPSSSPSGSPSPTDTTSETSAPSGTEIPSEGGSSSSSNHVGAIAGGVVGGVLGLALIAGILFLCRRRQRSEGQSTGHPRFLGAWGNLGSFESKTRSPAYSSAAGGATRSETQNNHYRTDSMGAPIMLSQASSPAATRLGHGDGSDEDGGFPPYQEKDLRTRSPSFDSRSPFTDVPIAIYNGASAGSRPTRHSSLSSTYNFSRRSTSQTFPESVHNSIASYGPPLINTSSTSFIAGSSPSSPQQTTSPVARKTPRKPVPSYVPDESVYGTSSDTAVPEDVEDDSAPIRRAIKHQDSFSSFQSKPMHVLMPDMPAPQRD